MRRLLASVSIAVMAASAASVSRAVDVWDSVSNSDDSAFSTGNVLWHTAPAQIHDLETQVPGFPDQDWFRIFPRARRSYEVQVLNVTDNSAFSFGTQRYAADGATVLQQGTALDLLGFTVTIRWIHGALDTMELVRQRGADGLTAASQYSIQFRETTLYCARYNNSGSQVSVLLIQRADPDRSNACSYEVRYNNAAGAETGVSAGTLAAVTGGNVLNVIDTSTVPGVGGTSGSAFIAHTCGFGGINAKLVALDPATGFSFDTPCLTRPTN